MYIFFDIDNTLVSHRGKPHIPPETMKAVELLRHNGHVPAIATGRAAFLTMTTAREFGINYLVCAGGSEVIAGGISIHTTYIPDGNVNKFLEVSAKFPDVTAAVDNEYLYADTPFDSFREYFNGQAGYDCFRPLSGLKRATMCYIMRPYSVLSPEHGIFFAPPEGLRLEKMHGFTEVRHESSTKWGGIEMMMRHFGAGTEDVIAFGGGPNDADMLRRAGTGVAVGRCSDEAREAADYVCGDIDEGGILKACEHLGLI